MSQFEKIAKEYFKNAFGKELVTEADGDGLDVLDPNQDSSLEELEAESPESSGDTSKLVFLTNLLLKALRFKTSDGLRAYLTQPRFKELTPLEKITSIRSVIDKHPERIFQEAEGDEMSPPEEPEVAEFGDADIELDAVTETDLLNLIIRAMKVDPFAITSTLGSLPSSATEDTYQDVITQIEGILI